MCAHAGIYACVCSYAPTTHIHINDFISSHVGNEQPEFWEISCEAGGFFFWFFLFVLEMNQHSSPLAILLLLLLPLHKKKIVVTRLARTKPPVCFRPVSARTLVFR